MEMPQKIRVSAMCIFYKDGKVLVAKGFDEVKNEYFYRVLGGGVDFQEIAEDAVRREIREELNSEIENLKFITVLENIFVFMGQKGHEIIYLYSGDLADKELYQRDSIRIIEKDHEFDAVWVSVEELNNPFNLYPLFDYKQLFKLN